jgi:hypothetical protein
MFRKLSTKDQRILTDEVNGIETSGSKAQADAKGAARNDSISQSQEWKNNKDVWVDDIKYAINLNANMETTNKAHQDAWNAVKGNPIAINKLKQLGYTYSAFSGRWTYEPNAKPSTEPRPNPSKGQRVSNF